MYIQNYTGNSDKKGINLYITKQRDAWLSEHIKKITKRQEVIKIEKYGSSYAPRDVNRRVGTPPAAKSRWREGRVWRRASSATPGLSHRRVSGQCDGVDTQSRCSWLSRLTDLQRTCSSEAAAVILRVRTWISLSSSVMRVSTSRRFRAPKGWRLVGEGECQHLSREGREGLEGRESCSWGTSIRWSTTRGNVFGRGTVWTGGDGRALGFFLCPCGAEQGSWVISWEEGKPWSSRV